MRYAIALAASLAATSPAGATVYELNPLKLWYQLDPSQTATLAGTITTDGTLGFGLGPPIITGWDFLLNDGTHSVELTNANAEITNPDNYYNPYRLIATPTDLSFDFSPTPTFSYLNFSSLTTARGGVSIFSAFPVSNPGQAGFEINLGFTDFGYVNYRSLQPETIATAVPTTAVPTPPALPLFATGLGLMALLAWRRSRLRLNLTDISEGTFAQCT